MANKKNFALPANIADAFRVFLVAIGKASPDLFHVYMHTGLRDKLNFKNKDFHINKFWFSEALKLGKTNPLGNCHCGTAWGLYKNDDA